MKDKGVLVDSDIIIWLLRGDKKIAEKLKTIFSQQPLFTTPITVSEIYAGARKNEEKVIADLFQSIEVLNINKEIGVMAGEWMNRYSKSHSLELADAMIAASTIEYELKLWTLNLKHYPMLKKDDFI